MKKVILIALAMFIVTGCKTTEPQYFYGQYNTAVYSYFKGDDSTVEDQITVLEEAIATAEANNKLIAPGIHAHLGMLYFETGDSKRGLEHFEVEKLLFPESTQYIDFLMSSSEETDDA